MQQWKITSEAAFGRFGHFAFTHPWYVLAIVSLCWLALLVQLPKMTSDTSMEGYLRVDDPVLDTYNQFREKFGSDELVIVAIESESIFSIEFLALLTKLHVRLEATVPYIDSVDSLVNARNIYGDEDELIVEDLLETPPGNAAELEALRQRVVNHPLYVDSLISKDATVTTLLLKLDAKYRIDAGDEVAEQQWNYLGDEQMQAIADAVSAVVDEYRTYFKTVHTGGSPAFNAAVNKEMQFNTVLFAALTILIIVVLLLLLYRRLSGVVLPLCLATLSLSSTFSALALFGIPFQLPMTILPSFILATGVAAAIHLLTIFYRIFDRDGDKRAAISEALSATGLAILFTSATTAAGLCSFAGADLVPVANMGLFAALSLVFTFFYCVTVLPALIALLPLRSRSLSENRYGSVVDRFTAVCATLAIRFPLAIVLVCGLLLLLGAASASRLNFSHDMKSWFPPDHPIITATDFIEEHFGGTVPVEIIVTAVEPLAMQEPSLLAQLENLQQELSDFSNDALDVGKTLGVSDLIKETNQALHANDAAFYQVPARRDLAAQEFFLLELSGADDLFERVDTDYQMARTTAMVPLLDAFHYGVFRQAIEQRYRDVLGDDIEVITTGMLPLLSKTMSDVVHSTARSYVLALVIISLMMIVLLGSVKFGLLSMLPNVFPIVIVLGMMNIFGAPLDMFSMTLGVIALGLAVDDTVHFMHNFKRLMHVTGDVAHSIRETLASTGKALTITTLVIALSFFCYMFSAMTNLYNFGLYTGLCIVLALLADLLLAPALMMLVYRSRSA